MKIQFVYEDLIAGNNLAFLEVDMSGFGLNPSAEDCWDMGRTLANADAIKNNFVNTPTLTQVGKSELTEEVPDPEES